MRRIWVVAVVIAVVAVGTLAVARRRSQERRPAAAATGTTAEGDADEGEGFGEGGDPDADASNHVGTVRVRNRVLAPAGTLAATGWAGEVQVANEDTWEPHVAADPSSG